MTPKETIRTSKFLSLVLRHEPERVGLQLDEAGWVAVDALLEAVNRHGVSLARKQLDHIVASSEKQRFAFSDDGLRIRANQGHSVEVELGYAPATPPDLLYHGTPEKFVAAIRREGLLKMERHHVHLSVDKATTLQVGARRGRPVLLTIRAGDMHRAGHVFYRSANNVWLVDDVPPKFILFP
jgi:putative RNA 2'-phosphotransferase